MEKLKKLKENLMDGVSSQVSRGLQNVNREELGDALDMIKDIEEIIYYCSITKAMEEKEKENEYMQKHYSSMYNYPMYYDGGSQYANNGGSRNYDGMNGRMWYNGGSSNYANNGSNSGGNNARGGGTRGYSDGWVMAPFDMRDYREGKSYMSRKNYMEGKEMHHDKAKQMQELDHYVQELTDDVLEMIHDASPEEKMALSQKMTTLANKIK